MRDDHPEKWGYREHTEVKHELLDKYLGGWLPILGRWHARLLIVDGFAGRGTYGGGEDGSPIVILRRAQDLISARRIGSVFCAFVEKNTKNYAELRALLNQVRPRYPDVTILGPFNDEFETMASGVIRESDGKLVPSFWFIDPFGFTGFQFETVKRIMALNRSEIFVTWMARDINRFLSHVDLHPSLDDLYGTRIWRRILKSHIAGRAREEALRELYADQLRSIGCKVTAFRVCMDDRLQTLYYMMHGTKSPKGRRLMKDVMSKQGAGGLFSYLGPQEQAAQMQGVLFKEDPIPVLKDQLLSRLSGRTISFEELRNECCDDDELRDPEYRTALKELRKDGSVAVKPVSSKTNRGLGGDDQITFPKT